MAPLVDVLARGEVLPFADESFDLVFCTQMLEYVEQPKQVIVEIHRVLKRGGTLLLSVPSIAPRDADEDAWRFLPAALRVLLRDFTQLQIQSEGGTITGFFRTAAVSVHIFSRYRAAQVFVSYTLVPALNLVGAALEKIVGSSNDVLTANFSVQAIK